MGQQPAGLLRRTQPAATPSTGPMSGCTGRCRPSPIAAATFAALAVLAWRNGRTYCNTDLSRGYGAGLPRRASRCCARVIDAYESATVADRCARNCKASCIDAEHAPDRLQPLRGLHGLHRHLPAKTPSRYELPAENPQAGERTRRASRAERRTPPVFRAAVFCRWYWVMFAATHGSPGRRRSSVDGGLAVIEQTRKFPAVRRPIVPPGAAEPASTWRAHCTGCQLCVAVCPNGRAAALRTTLTSLMQPEMSYERGYCRPECTKCSEVCPDGRDSARSRRQTSRPCRSAMPYGSGANCVSADRRRGMRQLRPPLPVGAPSRW